VSRVPTGNQKPRTSVVTLDFTSLIRGKGMNLNPTSIGFQRRRLGLKHLDDDDDDDDEI
jgi:hypothetical protein